MILSRLRPMLEQGGGGAAGALLRAVLAPFGCVAARWTVRRRAAWSGGGRMPWRAPFPVVSVGNLVAGGTGKTPCVAMLLPLLLDMGFLPAVVSRGYGAARGGENDETRMLRDLFPEAILCCHPDRRTAIEEADMALATCAVLDDGFQHLRVARDLDMVLLDATEPFGGGRVLPAGLLREPPGALSAADVVILTRCDRVGADALAGLDAQVRALAPGAEVLHAEHRPVRLAAPDGTETPPGSLAGRRVCAASAIARPEAFRATLEKLGAEVVAESVFPDHHAYRPADADRIRAEAMAAGAEVIVTTAKDWVKLRDLPLPSAEGVGWRVLHVEFTLREGTAPLREVLARHLVTDGAHGGGFSGMPLAERALGSLVCRSLACMAHHAGLYEAAERIRPGAIERLFGFGWRLFDPERLRADAEVFLRTMEALGRKFPALAKHPALARHTAFWHEAWLFPEDVALLAQAFREGTSPGNGANAASV